MSNEPKKSGGSIYLTERLVGWILDGLSLVMSRLSYCKENAHHYGLNPQRLNPHIGDVERLSNRMSEVVQSLANSGKEVDEEEVEIEEGEELDFKLMSIADAADAGVRLYSYSGSSIWVQVTEKKEGVEFDERDMVLLASALEFHRQKACGHLETLTSQSWPETMLKDLKGHVEQQRDVFKEYVHEREIARCFREWGLRATRDIWK